MRRKRVEYWEWRMTAAPEDEVEEKGYDEEEKKSRY